MSLEEIERGMDAITKVLSDMTTQLIIINKNLVDIYLGQSTVDTETIEKSLMSIDKALWEIAQK